MITVQGMNMMKTHCSCLTSPQVRKHTQADLTYMLHFITIFSSYCSTWVIDADPHTLRSTGVLSKSHILTHMFNIICGDSCFIVLNYKLSLLRVCRKKKQIGTAETCWYEEYTIEQI